MTLGSTDPERRQSKNTRGLVENRSEYEQDGSKKERDASSAGPLNQASHIANPPRTLMRLRFALRAKETRTQHSLPHSHINMQIANTERMSTLEHQHTQARNQRDHTVITLDTTSVSHPTNHTTHTIHSHGNLRHKPLQSVRVSVRGNRAAGEDRKRQNGVEKWAFRGARRNLRRKMVSHMSRTFLQNKNQNTQVAIQRYWMICDSEAGVSG